MASSEYPLRPTAATLVITYATANGEVVVLTRRPESMRRHPGQIAFPGGMIEPFDATPLQAAKREAREEVGLVLPEQIHALPLPSVGTLSGSIVIQPFWIRLDYPPALRAEPDEVDEILLVPLADIRAPERLSSIPHPRRPNERTPAIAWRGNVIWGATLRTLRDLFELLGHRG
jgi:8-oxo-dGTP pyrophosphatase MutT (NUDIX family)